MSLPACPVNGCANDRQAGDVMCSSCWFKVPKPLRDEVWRTYRAQSAWADESVEIRERAIVFAERELARVSA